MRTFRDRLWYSLTTPSVLIRSFIFTSLLLNGLGAIGLLILGLVTGKHELLFVSLVCFGGFVLSFLARLLSSWKVAGYIVDEPEYDLLDDGPEEDDD